MAWILSYENLGSTYEVIIDKKRKKKVKIFYWLKGSDSGEDLVKWHTTNDPTVGNNGEKNFGQK